VANPHFLYLPELAPLLLCTFVSVHSTPSAQLSTVDTNHSGRSLHQYGPQLCRNIERESIISKSLDDTSGEKERLANSQTEIDNTNGKAGCAPKIQVQISPDHPLLSVSPSGPTPLFLEFVLQSQGPITVYVPNTILRPALSPGTIHGSFEFVDTLSGTQYLPPTVDVHYIVDPADYEVSHKNADKFVTLWPGVPYRVERLVGLAKYATTPMKVGRSYRVDLGSYQTSQHIWWSSGRKWQVLRWGWWPWGEAKSVCDYVCRFPGAEKLPEIEFECVKTCTVTVVE
jgi:hypothetical protein